MKIRRLDQVHAVFHAALKLLEMILVDFIPKHKLGKAEVSHAVNHTLPALIQKTGETVSSLFSTVKSIKTFYFLIKGL